MKAFLLAAGLGTRLRPLTDSMPKCLVPICGKPLMGWWFDLFEKHGVSEVLVNTHYMPEQVRGFISGYNALRRGVIVHEFYEPELLGSGGTVAANKGFVWDDESFLICYADNLTDLNLTELLDFHAAHDGLLTMALFRTSTPEQCGIVALDSSGRISEFEEKPLRPKSNLANAGIYAVRRALLGCLPNEGFCDFGRDILPMLSGEMYGYELHNYLIDIGTHDNLKKAREEWKNDHL